MYFDTLSLTGLLVAASYALLPLLFGREVLRVVDDAPDGALPLSPASASIAMKTRPSVPAVASPQRRIGAGRADGIATT
jgi:hypothetical protein